MPTTICRPRGDAWESISLATLYSTRGTVSRGSRAWRKETVSGRASTLLQASGSEVEEESEPRAPAPLAVVSDRIVRRSGSMAETRSTAVACLNAGVSRCGSRTLTFASSESNAAGEGVAASSLPAKAKASEDSAEGRTREARDG